MGIAKFLLSNLDMVVVGLSPAVVYGIYRVNKFKPRDNNLMHLEIKRRKMMKVIEKQVK